MKFQILLVAVFVALAVADKVDYTGHKVIRVVPQTDFQLRFLHKLTKESYDFWSEPSIVGNPVDIRLSPNDFNRVTMLLEGLGISYNVNIPDVGKLIQDEEMEIAAHQAKNGKAFDWAAYHTYDDIVAWMNALVTSHPSRVRTETIGTTSQGRNIVMARVSSNLSANKRVLFFECATHAREWVTPPTCLWIVNELVTKYGTDPEITSLLDYADWLVSPISNPDGYTYTWNTDRLWRKNRQSVEGSVCNGTDPNRNFDAGFGGPGTSDNPCDDTYHGPHAFSSPEASAIRDVLIAHEGRTLAAVSIHSYSQLWMSPYGYKSELPADYTEQLRVMNISVAALKVPYGTQYRFGNIANTIYLAAGSSIDYAYDTHRVKYAYALELRDTGLFGFQLPARQIEPTAIETWNGLKAMVQEIQKVEP